jgi:hypothetical protein
MCKKLLDNIFKKKVEENRNRLGFNIDEDFGLVVIHEFFWEYEEFRSYDLASAEKATEEEREIEENRTDAHLEELNVLMGS